MIALNPPVLATPAKQRPTPREMSEMGPAANGNARRLRDIQARYDAASSISDHENYWANADAYDADSANRRDVRETLVRRSRYEVWNNGYADGIAQTYANALVGLGPKLRMQSGSDGFNRMVELEWWRWSQAIQLRRKLWCQAHAKHTDGEGFGVARTNPGVDHPVKLDYVLYETEQFQSPEMYFARVGQLDGIEFDQWGNPVMYELLRSHPGSGDYYGLHDSEKLPARYVMQWFTMRRPGQHRGIPESTSTLNVGAASRRWREATIAAAETAADFAVLLKTTMDPDTVDAVVPFSSQDIQKRMMTALPAGYDLSQLRAEHPNSTYEAFHRAQINEQARPKNMPYNVAACDSSSYNYASGRLDHLVYQQALDVDRSDGNALVLTPLFRVWFEEAVRVFRWLGGDPRTIGRGASDHTWDWPKHSVADRVSEANANQIEIRNGMKSLTRLYADAGEDFADEVEVMATGYGVSVQEMRDILRTAIFNAQNQQASIATAEAQQKQADNAAKASTEPETDDTETESDET